MKTGRDPLVSFSQPATPTSKQGNQQVWITPPGFVRGSWGFEPRSSSLPKYALLPKPCL